MPCPLTKNSYSNGAGQPQHESVQCVSVVVYEAWRQLGYPGAVLRISYAMPDKMRYEPHRIRHDQGH